MSQRCGCADRPCEMPRLATQPSFSAVPQLQTSQRLDFSPIDPGADVSPVAGFASPLVVVFAVLFIFVWRRGGNAAWCVLDLSGYRQSMARSRRRRLDLRLRLSESERRFLTSLRSLGICRFRPLQREAIPAGR